MSMKNILNPQASGLFGKIIRAILSPIGVLYGGTMLIRSALYQKNILKSFRPIQPVISIGNISLGGTGKTPFVIWICDKLNKLSKKTTILTRGYGSKNPDQADEVILLRKKLPFVEVLAGSNRIENAQKANGDVLVIDDGFQHLKIKRDLNIVLLDARTPIGLPLPAGLFREFSTSLNRADIIVLTRCEMVDHDILQKTIKRLKQKFTSIPIAVSSHVPTALFNMFGEEKSLDFLSDRDVRAVSGIGQPESFHWMLKRLGANVVETCVFKDHQAYTESDLESFKSETLTIITTAKDAVKLPPLSNVYILHIEISVSSEVEEMMMSVL